MIGPHSPYSQVAMARSRAFRSPISQISVWPTKRPLQAHKRKPNGRQTITYKLEMMAITRKLLIDLFPEFVAELEQILLEQRESELARQVSTLPVIDRCRCGDDFCGMFYVCRNQEEPTAPVIVTFR